MNLGYLYSIINLYVKRENKTKKACLSIVRKNENIEFSFYMHDNINDKTLVTLPLDIVLENRQEILNMYKDAKIVISENNIDNCYTITFNNGRTLSFLNFSLSEINDWRNSLYNISIRNEEMRITLPLNETFEKKNLRLQIAGFSSYLTLLFSVAFLSTVFLTSLLLWKVLL